MQWIDVSHEVLGKLKYLMDILKVPEGARCFYCSKPAWRIQQTMVADRIAPRFLYVCKECYKEVKDA